MGVFVKEVEITSSVAPAKMFKAFVLDADEVYPKIFPQAFKSIESIEIIEGDGGAGTIKKVTFSDEEKFKYLKHRVDLLDKEKLVYHYTWIEGDALMNMFEKVEYEIKFEARHGGCVCKIKTTFFFIGEPKVDEAELKAGEEKVVGIFKGVEGYVLASL